MNIKDKYKKNMCCLDKWLANCENEKRIADYLSIYHIQKVGIYGYGILGKHLVKELQGQNFHISWVMDRSASGDDICFELVRPCDSDKLEDVDMVIITTLADVEEVEVFLMGFVTGRIISIEELIDSIFVWGNKK